MNIKKTDISCPICKTKGTYTPDNAYRPFCSYRCKLIDLGDWADEKHRIPDSDATDIEEKKILDEDE